MRFVKIFVTMRRPSFSGHGAGRCLAATIAPRATNTDADTATAVTVLVDGLRLPTVIAARLECVHWEDVILTLILLAGLSVVVTRSVPLFLTSTWIPRVPRRILSNRVLSKGTGSSIVRSRREIACFWPTLLGGPSRFSQNKVKKTLSGAHFL